MMHRFRSKPCRSEDSSDLEGSIESTSSKADSKQRPFNAPYSLRFRRATLVLIVFLGLLLSTSVSLQRRLLSNQETTNESFLRTCLRNEFRNHYTWPTTTKASRDQATVRIQAQLIARQLCVYTDHLPFSDDELQTILFDDSGPTNDNNKNYHTLLSERCEKHATRHLVFSNLQRRVGTGLGSRLHMIAVGLHHSTFLNRPRAFRRVLALETGHWAYAPRDCVERDYRCYFVPFTACTAHPKKWNFFVRQQDQRNALRWRDNWLFQLSHRKTMQMPENHATKLAPTSNEVPAEFVDKGWLWYVSQLLFFAIQPNTQTRLEAEAEIERMQQSFGRDWKGQGRCVAMHVRHGDKAKEAETYDFLDYLERLRALKNATGIDRVLAFSDDPRIDAFCQEHSDEFQFHLAGEVRDASEGSAAVRLATSDSDYDAGRETRPMLNTLFAATKCDHFLGTASSGWSRTVLKLMVATNQNISYMSLDDWDYDQTGSGPADWEIASTIENWWSTR